MKMKSKPSIAIAFLIFIAASCANTNNEEQTVSGKIDNASGKQVDLIGFVNGEPDTIGTQVLTESGEFSIPVNAGRLAFYQLAVENNGALVLAFDSTESPRIEADLHYINQKYSVQGSKDSERICELFNNSVTYETELDSTMKLMRDAAQAGDNANRLELSVHYNDLRKEYKDYLLSFIDADTTSAANFSVLQRLDPKQDGEYFIKVRNGLAPRMQGNVFFDQLANNVAKIEHEMKMNASTGIGKPAPDIVLPNPDGEEIALSSLRGIMFWLTSGHRGVNPVEWKTPTWLNSTTSTKTKTLRFMEFPWIEIKTNGSMPLLKIISPGNMLATCNSGTPQQLNCTTLPAFLLPFLLIRRERSLRSAFAVKP
jgi:hypothetical protein